MRRINRFFKLIAFVLSFLLIVPVFSACSFESLEGVHVFMFKQTGNKFADLMFEGFNSAITAAGEKAYYKSPAEATVAEQIELLDTLIIQKVKSITISASGFVGYEPVLKKAKEAGIKVISADSFITSAGRITHVDSCSYEAVGSSLIQAATLIALKKSYPLDGDLETATRNALNEYSGKEKVFGIIGASVDTVATNTWIEKMKEEVKKEMYRGKVSADIEVKYGNDDMNVSRVCADAFIASDNVDVIISPNTIGMFAAGQAIKFAGSSIKLTGLGLPSEMQAFMPVNETDDEFAFPCPYMMLWDVVEFGAVAGAVILEVCNNGFDGSVGSEIVYKGKTHVVQSFFDGGTTVIAVEPYPFHKGNMKQWINKL